MFCCTEKKKNHTKYLAARSVEGVDALKQKLLHLDLRIETGFAGAQNAFDSLSLALYEFWEPKGSLRAVAGTYEFTNLLLACTSLRFMG